MYSFEHFVFDVEECKLGFRCATVDTTGLLIDSKHTASLWIRVEEVIRGQL